MKPYTDADIKWIKQYRIDNECGLQEAKRVFLLNRIKGNLHNMMPGPLKDIIEDMLELRIT
jgi:hypothetical protein